MTGSVSYGNRAGTGGDGGAGGGGSSGRGADGSGGVGSGGGGIFTTQGTMKVTNTTVAGNDAGSGERAAASRATGAPAETGCG